MRLILKKAALITSVILYYMRRGFVQYMQTLRVPSREPGVVVGVEVRVEGASHRRCFHLEPRGKHQNEEHHRKDHVRQCVLPHYIHVFHVQCFHGVVCLFSGVAGIMASNANVAHR